MSILILRLYRICHRRVHGQANTDAEESFLGHTEDSRAKERRRSRQSRRSHQSRWPLTHPSLPSRTRPRLDIWSQHPVGSRRDVGSWHSVGSWYSVGTRPTVWSWDPAARIVQPRADLSRNHVQPRLWHRSPAQSHRSRWKYVVRFADGCRLGPHAQTNRKRRKYFYLAFYLYLYFVPDPCHPNIAHIEDWQARLSSFQSIIIVYIFYFYFLKKFKYYRYV